MLRMERLVPLLRARVFEVKDLEEADSPYSSIQPPEERERFFQHWISSSCVYEY